MTVPSGRARTSPSTSTTNSLRTRSTPSAPGASGSTTTCTTPAASRTSRNTTPPWSRRVATQPHTTTAVPACSDRSSPARCVRIIGRTRGATAASPPADRAARRPAVPVRRSFTPTSPRLTSSGARITANAALDRLAAVICAFIERPPKARSTRNPASRSSWVQLECVAPDPEPVHDERVQDRLGGCHRTLGVGDDQQPLDPDPEADPGRGRTAHILGELVVAPAAADRVLGGVERVAHELERGARVVVEPAHQARIELVLDSERVEAALYRLEVHPRLVAQMLGELRCPLDDVRPRVVLGVEHAQRVVLDPLAELGPSVAAVVQEVARGARRRTRARLSGSPIELSSSLQRSSPSSRRNPASSAITSTSTSGSSTPSASTPSCQCWRYRPFCGRS